MVRAKKKYINNTYQQHLTKVSLAIEVLFGVNKIASFRPDLSILRDDLYVSHVTTLLSVTHS